MRSARSSTNLTGDALYDMTMQHVGELRTDAAHGRDYRRTHAAVPSNTAETVQNAAAVVPTSSTISLVQREPSFARRNR